MIPANPSDGRQNPAVSRKPDPVRPLNRDAEFMRYIPGLINTIADGDPAIQIEWKNTVRLRRLSGASWESVYRLLAQAAYPSI
jgi:hypothetical protein